MKYRSLIEEPLKSAVYQDFFSNYKYTQLGRIDFVIAKHELEDKNAILFEEEKDLKSILWAEAKQGTSHDIYESFVQLILTIGKEKTFEKYLPPKYIGAFDAEKIAFIEYHNIQSVFYQNDFNWNVTPSNHDSKEFKQLFEMTKNLLEESAMIFFYEKSEKELKEFIALNFKTNKDISEKISVTKNNFTFVFQRWTETVKPTIAVNWEKVNKKGVISADFFLADLLSSENQSLKENLFVILQKNCYKYGKEINDDDELIEKIAQFNDKQKAHKAFWAIYERPPKEEYWSYIIERRDLLVPQDIRERKGSFFTPKKWVELSQKYLADILGENWQDEYYIWDCCAGTGNLLNGLTNYRNVWASTLDKADVDVMKDRIQNGWNMFENHVFQFDFLNDDFSKLPDELREIVESEEKRKKLVIYINPPYAEAGTTRTKTKTGKNKENVAKSNRTFEKYKDSIGTAANEIFAEFLIRIHAEIQCCKVAHFATLKALCAPNFARFRNVFSATPKKFFVVPANTFDNVKGDFPIGFQIWDCGETRKECSLSVEADVYNKDSVKIGTKLFFTPPQKRLWMDWVKTMHDKRGELIGHFRTTCSDFQNQTGTFITSQPSANDILQVRTHEITKNNLALISIAFATRMCIEPTWLNDRDQFLYPSDDWQNDKEFQLDCLVFTLFHGQNRISAEHGVNHWIPFTESEVGSKKAFKSVFMSKFIKDFLAGRIDLNPRPLLLAGEGELDLSQDNGEQQNFPLASKERGLGGEVRFSTEAEAVYSAGLELWKFYFAQCGENENASFYDIRKHFQGTDEKGRMNNKSSDEQYNALIDDLRAKQKKLASKIAEKVYEYGFLRR